MWRALRRFYKIFEDFQRESKKYVCCPKAIIMGLDPKDLCERELTSIGTSLT